MRFKQLFPLAVAAALMGPATAAASDINLLFIGNSITYGAGLNEPESSAPPAICSEILRKRPDVGRVNVINAGCSGSTSTDWAPASADLYPRFIARADSLTDATADALTVISIALGTNDSACDRCTGAPASCRTFRDNLRTLTDSLLTRYPGAVAVIHTPLWYSDNTYNGARYMLEGQQRLLPYRAEIEALVGEYVGREPGRVWLGDTIGYGHFERSHRLEMQAEQGHAGTFYLHPNERGAASLGAFWAEAISKALDQRRERGLKSKRY